MRSPFQQMIRLNSRENLTAKCHKLVIKFIQRHTVLNLQENGIANLSIFCECFLFSDTIWYIYFQWDFLGWLGSWVKEQLAKRFQRCQYTQCWHEKSGIIQQPDTPMVAHCLSVWQSQRHQHIPGGQEQGLHGEIPPQSQSFNWVAENCHPE